MNSFNVFDVEPLDRYLESKKREMVNLIEEKSEEDFLKEDKDELVNQLMEQYKIEVTINFDNIDIQSEDVGGTDIFIYKIPFKTNNIDYFRLRPDNRLLWTIKVDIVNDELCFEIIDHKNDFVNVKNDAERAINNLKKQVSNVNAVINPYNALLQEYIEGIYNKRKERIANREGKLKSLKDAL